ncbi:hypothetical protein CP533_3133 [Ophiocordyceps camponoti-saundersi (nom. inval.)]|nr:hypothetical protein CP533_3133 [Ophiocordyceps camponoti-saundersi (nom. inval.)]
MALFPPRKKTAMLSSSMEPLSKAHKILGSTPLSIDSPPNRDDASSSDDTSLTSVTSCDDAFDDVGIAKSDNDSDFFPRHPRLDFDDSDAGRSILRKSRSSSTIKSWYDKSKLPLSVSQQTSSSAMAKGPPTSGNCHKSRGHHKKKPAGLDPGVCPVSPAAHLGQPAVGLVLGPELVMKSPSILSTITQRPRQRRHTQETLPSPGPGAPWPRPNDALNELPTLYDNYERRSMRHVMRQYSQPDLSQPKPSHSPARPKKSKQAGGGPNWFHDPAPLNHRTAHEWKSSERKSPTTNSTRTVSSRQTQTSNSSKTTDKSFGHADLRQTSVLLLSDSEGEDDIVLPYLKSPTLASVKRRTSLVSVERRPSMPEIRLPPRVSSLLRLSDEASTDVESPPQVGKLKKRASFSLAHTFTTLPSRAMDSASVTRSSPPRRASLVSTHSVNSAHSRNSSYSIREARAVTLQAARHKSSSAQETLDEVPQQSVDWKPTFERDSVASSSTDQLTPPLSPTSVDFYIRSARSSVDGPNTHSRLMAVSRQEEMLLSALRHRQRNIRSSSLAELRESHEWEREEGDEDAEPGTERWRRTAQRRGSRDQRIRASQRPTAQLAVIGLELGGRHERQSRSQSLRRWSAAAAAVDADSGRSNKHDSEDSICDQLFEKVPLFLDTEPRPDLSDFRDWHAALESRSQRREDGKKSDSDAESNQFHPESFARLAGVMEEPLATETGVPRPDSPVSPETFPAAASERTSKAARLSVLGPGLLAAGSESRGRPGWKKP